MSDVARVPAVRQRFPMIAQALLLGASAQLRNMASMGGNLCQRVRCSYFRDVDLAVQQARPRQRLRGARRFQPGPRHPGASDNCIATHPSDVAVALVALDAVVHTRGPAASGPSASTTSSSCPGIRPSGSIRWSTAS